MDRLRGRLTALLGAFLGRTVAIMAAGDPALAAAATCGPRLHAATLHFLDAACERAASDSNFDTPDLSAGTLACDGAPSRGPVATDFVPAWYYLPLREYRARELVPEQWVGEPAAPSAWSRDETGLHRTDIVARRQFRHTLRFDFDAGGAAPLRTAAAVMSPVLDAWIAQLEAARSDPEALRWLSWSIRTRRLGCTPEALIDRWIHRAHAMRADARDNPETMFAAVASVGKVPAGIVLHAVHTSADGGTDMLIVDSMPAPSTLFDPFGKRTVHNGINAAIHHIGGVAATLTGIRAIRVGMSLRADAEAMRRAGFERGEPGAQPETPSETPAATPPATPAATSPAAVRHEAL